MTVYAKYDRLFSSININNKSFFANIKTITLYI